MYINYKFAYTFFKKDCKSETTKRFGEANSAVMPDRKIEKRINQRRYTDIQRYRYKGTQRYRYTDIQIYRYTEIQIYRYRNIQISNAPKK
jgi:hypothetical protein